jgi:hypothetical protein
MSAESKPQWRSVFTRVRDDDAGLPRFYIRGTKDHLSEYDGYMERHIVLNEILEFLGGNDKEGWTRSDSPMNVSTYEYVAYFDLDDEDAEDRLEIFGGNYMFCENPQGAFIIGFKLFRALILHLGLSQPRTLKGEATSIK